MGSVVPFQDLNLFPTSPPSSSSSAAADVSTPAATAAAIPLKVPKLEPKLEPLDDYYETPQQLQQQLLQQHFFPDSTPDFFPNSQNTPTSQSPADEQGNVFSEYNRISELFHAAFAKRMQQRYDDISVLESPDARAIVPVSEALESTAASAVVARPHHRKYQQRSSELVRVTDLGVEDQRYFRDIVRRTRMVYDALRIYSVIEEGKRRSGAGCAPATAIAAATSAAGVSGGGGGGEGEEGSEAPVPVGRRFYRPRGDLMASSLMRDRGLWLNRDKRIVGSIPGIEVGDIFFFRMELCVVGLHGQVQAGIDYLPAAHSANGEPIATSIIVSGGYEDDMDSGEELIYTGHGGQDKLGRQSTHQKLEGGNLALERSMHYGIEVRVIRGFKYEGSISSKIYVYDGLYKIIDCWFDVGKSGFGVYKYKLVRIEGQPEMGSSILKFAQNLRTQPLSMRPRGYLSLDISNKKENMPVLFFNDIDNAHDPLCYDYLVRTVFPPYAFGQGSNGTGCECVSDCSDGCFCAMKNGGEFAYDHNGFLLRGKPVIFECGSFCSCPPSCRNRVSQRGLKNRLEVFRSRETGWGVRSLDLIHSGAFICEYTGVVLTREQAQVFTMNGDSLIYPHRFSSRWVEWGDLSQIYSDYARPSYPSIPPLDFAMDVSRMRNVACYMSHSSTPNVMVQFVLYDHNNLMFPHLMLFAMENVPPLRELSLDYGVDDEWTGKLAICS